MLSVLAVHRLFNILICIYLQTWPKVIMTVPLSQQILVWTHIYTGYFPLPPPFQYWELHAGNIYTLLYFTSIISDSWHSGQIFDWFVSRMWVSTMAHSKINIAQEQFEFEKNQGTPFIQDILIIYQSGKDLTHVSKKIRKDDLLN